jgi:hypothetical protein
VGDVWDLEKYLLENKYFYIKCSPVFLLMPEEMKN